MIKAVIFDMDGVITDTMPFHFEAWRRVFKTVDIEVSCYDVYLREGEKGIDSIQQICKDRNGEISPAHAKRLLAEKEEIFKKIFRRRFIKGSRPLLRGLKRKGYRLALVTGTSRDEMRNVLPDEIFGLFDVSVTATEVRNGKPHPDPYKKALRALKISADEAIVVENAPYGIRSAKAAGIFCIAVTTSLPAKYLKEADRVVAALREVYEICNLNDKR